MAEYMYSYEQLKKKYGEFSYPMVHLLVAGKDFSRNKSGLVLADMQVELSVGMEASVVTFHCYNSFDEKEHSYVFDNLKTYLTLGLDVSVQLGYADNLTEVFCGFISQVEFVSRPGEPHHVEVTAMDVKGLMMSNCAARQMRAGSYGEAVKEIFAQPIYQNMQSVGIIRGIKIADTPDKEQAKGQNAPTSVSVEMVSESDYEFVVKAAKRFSYEFYVDNGNVCFRRGMDRQTGCLMEIGIAQGMIYYRIGYDITGLAKSVEVRGMDMAKGEAVTAKKSASNKISMGNKAASLISRTQKLYIDSGAVTRQIAGQRAEAILEEVSCRFGSLECECIGIPELKPGYYIQISGLGKPADNRFYITNVHHRITDVGGYRTILTGKAPSLA